jgi:hypothetical protein
LFDANLDATLASGSYEANPPFVPILVEQMLERMMLLLRRAAQLDDELLFCIIIGASAGTRKHAAWEELMRAASGAFGRAHWQLVLQKHGYLAGHAHIEKAADRRRMSSCDTSVVVLATDAAARRWPASPTAESTFRAACELALPRRLKRPSHAMKARSRAKRARSRSSVHSS